MVPYLTTQEQEWLRVNHPKLFYYSDYGHIVGDFEFRATYNNITIKDRYEIDIALFKRHIVLPTVYVTNNRIERARCKLGRDRADMHIYEDNSICLIRPDKVKDYYPNLIVTIPVFMYHLTTYFYWQSYLETYDSEPWKGEEHGWPLQQK